MTMTIGSSVYEIDRLKKLTAKPKFISRFFTPHEMKFLMERHFPPYSISEMFAAKTAFIKAMGINAQGVKLNEISVLTDYSGAYYLSFSGKAKTAVAAKRCRAAVTCAHTRHIVTANVVLYD